MISHFVACFVSWQMGLRNLSNHVDYEARNVFIRQDYKFGLIKNRECTVCAGIVIEKKRSSSL